MTISSFFMKSLIILLFPCTLILVLIYSIKTGRFDENSHRLTMVIFLIGISIISLASLFVLLKKLPVLTNKEVWTIFTRKIPFSKKYKNMIPNTVLPNKVNKNSVFPYKRFNVNGEFPGFSNGNIFFIYVDAKLFTELSKCQKDVRIVSRYHLVLLNQDTMEHTNEYSKYTFELASRNKNNLSKMKLLFG